MPEKRTTRASRIGRRPYRNRVDITCETCGTVKSKPVSQARSAHQFCSKACQAKSQERPVDLMCQWCEQAFQRPASLAHRKFCSNSCSRQHQYNADTIARLHKGAVRGGVTINGVPCLLRPKNIRHGGHSGITYQNKSMGAHVLAWMLAHGPVPEGKEVCHLCHMPACCEVAHLYIGTHEDNMAHSARDLRLHAKLTPDDVREIRRLHAEGVSITDMVPQFEVTYMTIHALLNGRTWKHVV